MIHLWGNSRIVEESDNLIVVIANSSGGNGASSLHTHNRHDNGIVVVSGQCRVWYPDSENVIHFETLHPGDHTNFPAGTPHRLQFLFPAKIIEWYIPVAGEKGRATLADIQRLEGGWAPRELKAVG